MKKMEQFLKKCNLSSLIPVFLESEIDYEAMLVLNERDIECLIPSIGMRAKFRNHLEHLRNQGSIDPSPNFTANEISLPQREEFPEPSSNEWYLWNLDSSDSIPPSTSTSTFPKLPEPALPTTYHDLGLVEHVDKKHEDPCLPSKTTKMSKRLAYPTPLPNLSLHLDDMISKGKLLQNSHRFVREAGNYLLTLTNGVPTSSDYNVYSRTLVEKYTDYKDDNITRPNATLSLQLSHFVRNKRYLEKDKTDPGKTTIKKPKVYDSASTASEPKPTSDNNILLELMAELKSGTGGREQMEQLLAKTVDMRRDIVSKASGVMEIMNEFPHLGNFHLLLHDFTLMKEFKSPVEISKAFEMIVKTLKKPNSPSLNEVEKLLLLIDVQKSLGPKAHPTHRRAITMFQAGGPVSLNTSSTQGPCISVFHDGKGNIVNFFLMAQSHIICKANHSDNLTACRVITALVGAYFVLDFQYPSAYEGLMYFLESKLLGLIKAKRGNLCYNKYIKSYNAKETMLQSLHQPNQ